MLWVKWIWEDEWFVGIERMLDFGRREAGFIVDGKGEIELGGGWV